MRRVGHGELGEPGGFPVHSLNGGKAGVTMNDVLLWTPRQVRSENSQSVGKATVLAIVVTTEPIPDVLRQLLELVGWCMSSPELFGQRVLQT